MGCRGVLFAITDDTVAALLAADGDDEAVMSIVEEIEEAWDKPHLVETDKAWDAMHRALSPTPPLDRAILGGRQLHQGEDYIVALVDKTDVPVLARALARVDMGERYDTVVPEDYSAEYGEDDRAYTVDYFAGVVDFYTRAADAGRAVLFTVDQMIVPDGHEVRTLRGGIDPMVARLPGGLLVACTGLGGDDQVAEVTALVGQLATQIAPHVVHVAEEMFGPPTRELANAAVIYFQSGSLAGFSDAARDDLGRRLRGLPTDLFVYADPGVPLRFDGLRTPGEDGTFIVEVRRPDGSITTGFVTGTPTPIAADPEAPLARAPRFAALVLALTDEPTIEVRRALDDYLVARTASLALIATKGPSGQFGIAPRSWQDRSGIVAYGDERSLHRAARDIGLPPGSYAVAAMPPKKLFAWAASIAQPVMLCAFDDRPNGTQSAWHAMLDVADLRRLGA